MKNKARIISGLAAVFALCLSSTFSMGKSEDKYEGKKQIRIMYYWGDTDTDSSAQAMREILDKEFPEKFPDVTLVEDVCDNETYKIKMKILAAADEMPDIVFGYGGGSTRLYAEHGLFLPIQDYLDEFYLDHMINTLQQDFMFDGIQYGIGFTSWKGVLYCNTELLKQAGCEVPRTLDELVNTCKALREVGIEPIALGMLNQWQGQQFLNNFTIQLSSAEEYRAMAFGEKGMYNDILEAAAACTMRLINADAFLKNRFSLTSGQAEEIFLSGGAAMIYIGSWYTKTAEERLGKKLAVARMPLVSEEANTLDYHGGVSNGWFVSAETLYPELACEIASWLAYRLSCYQPANSTFEIEPEDQVGEISEMQQQVIDLYADSEEYGEGGAAWDVLLAPQKVSYWLDTCGKLFEEKISAKAFTLLLGSEFG